MRFETGTVLYGLKLYHAKFFLRCGLFYSLLSPDPTRVTGSPFL